MMTSSEPIADRSYELETGVTGLRLIPADRNLTGAEVEMVSLSGRESRIRQALHEVRNRYDYIFIDTPPSLGLLTLNALVAADSVLIPLNCEYFALEGLAELMSTMARVKAGLNPRLEIEGVLLTMADSRTRLGQQVAGEVRLRIKINKKHFLLAQRKGCGEVDGCCRLAHTTFLIGDGDDLTHIMSIDQNGG